MYIYIYIYIYIHIYICPPYFRYHVSHPPTPSLQNRPSRPRLVASTLSYIYIYIFIFIYNISLSLSLSRVLHTSDLTYLTPSLQQQGIKVTSRRVNTLVYVCVCVRALPMFDITYLTFPPPSFNDKPSR